MFHVIPSSEPFWQTGIWMSSGISALWLHCLCWSFSCFHYFSYVEREYRISCFPEENLSRIVHNILMEHFYDAPKMDFKCDFYLLFVMKQRGNGLFYCLVTHRKIFISVETLPWSAAKRTFVHWAGWDLCRAGRYLRRTSQGGIYVD